MSNILITGGTGYIGSNIAVELLNQGHQVTIIDSLINSDYDRVNEIEQCSEKFVNFVKGDINDIKLVQKLLIRNHIDCVIDTVGFKSVPESVDQPLAYFRNNVGNLINLLTAMENANVKKIVFSSSACVYGKPKHNPVNEVDIVKHATNPYGTTKIQSEQILQDVVNSNHGWTAIALRYFNPMGAQANGLLGDQPAGKANNLAPAIAEVLTHKREALSIYGNDYATNDGSAVRDYVHVIDLAKGHVKAVELALNHLNYFNAINLGSGVGYSVLAIKDAFEKASHQIIPFQIKDRRAGDADITIASIDKAARLLNWHPTYSLDDMCQSNWHFLQQRVLIHN